MTKPPEEPGLVLATRWFTVTLSSRTVRILAAILAVATLFTVLGAFLPMAVHTYSPVENFVEVHDFSAEDQSIAADAIVVTFDRTAAGDYQATFTAELVRIGENGSRAWVDGWRRDAVIESGRHQMKTALPINEDSRQYIVPGTYSVRFDIQLQTGTGVTRQLSVETPPFELTPPADAESESAEEPVRLRVS